MEDATAEYEAADAKLRYRFSYTPMPRPPDAAPRVVAHSLARLATLRLVRPACRRVCCVFDVSACVRPLWVRLRNAFYVLPRKQDVFVVDVCCGIGRA